MASRSTTKELYNNKDELLSISIFMSLKRLNTLRKTSKKVNQWLSDFSSFSWKKRIELSFPSSFKDVLKEDVKDQMTKLRKFDTLVDSGHQVSFFLLSSLLDAEDIEVNMKSQIPWSRHVYLINYNKTEVAVFDSLLGKVWSRLNFPEMKSIDTVLFDTKKHKIGFINKESGVMKLYVLKNNELKHEADFESYILKFNGLISQLYGDYVIVNDGSKLVWYSLSTNTAVKEVALPEDDNGEGVFAYPSSIEPVVFVTAPAGKGYTIHRVDCTLEDEEPMQELYRSGSGITYDNCGDGLESVDLVETEDGRVLQVYLLGTGDREFHAYDLDANKRLTALHFDEFWNYESIKYNPGSTFYSLNDGPVLAIMNAVEKYEDEKCDVRRKNLADEDPDYIYLDSDEESYESEEEKEDPTKGAYFKFNSKIQRSKWLNKDLLTVKSAKKLRFFSIAQRGIIGSIDADINDVFIADNTIVAFTAAGDIYRVTLDAGTTEKKRNSQASNTNKTKKGSSNEKTAPASESDEDEEPPKKKKKVQAR